MFDSDHDRELIGQAVQVPAAAVRRPVYFALVLATAAAGVDMMFDIVRSNGVNYLEVMILILFALSFSWIAMAFWTATVGFVLQLCRLDPLSLRRRCDRSPPAAPLVTRTAVVMPIYNEQTRRVLAGFEATWRDLQATGHGAAFDFYLLSDTTEPTIAAAEADAWQALRRRLRGGSGLYYRRRAANAGRKAGNIAEFCCRWGAYYEHMVVLDADSIMTGATLTALVRAMQANPAAGIIQTVPLPVRQDTLFGRSLQFAAALYSPMLATGLCFWQTDTINYWGHNAILRVSAFMAHCGLPALPGRPPLGGEILSHDFVESALIRRGGWTAYLFPELAGSYEEVPSNALDYAKRDRRWTEGNLQHLRLVTASGLHPLSRLHFVMGAFAYSCSFLWLLMLLVGTVDAAARALTTPEFFYYGAQLFPDWPVARVSEIRELLAGVVALLLLPKLQSVLLALCVAERRRSFGGGVRLVASALFELVFSIMLAPVMMTFHAWFVAAVVCGRRVTWGPQSRDGRYVPWREAFRSTWFLSLAGLAWGIGTWWVTPIFFWALTPVLFGLVCAAPLVCLSSRVDHGMGLRKLGGLWSPSETAPDPVLRTVADLATRYAADAWVHAPGGAAAAPAELADANNSAMALLRDRPRRMPVQSLDRGPEAPSPGPFLHLARAPQRVRSRPSRPDG